MCFEPKREFGADLSVDVSYEWLTFFLEDDEKLAKIAEDYSTGKMLTGEIKKELIAVVSVSTYLHCIYCIYYILYIDSIIIV